MKKGTITWLRWWLFFSLITVGTFLLYRFNIFEIVLKSDITYISVLIYFLIVTITLRIGIQTYKACVKRAFISPKDIRLNGFTATLLPMLGLLGTVIGLAFLTDNVFSSLSAQSNIQASTLLSFGIGFGTAIYTTIAGIVGNILIRIQNFNLIQFLEE